jgi:hypothetical protein
MGATTEPPRGRRGGTEGLHGRGHHERNLETATAETSLIDAFETIQGRASDGYR